MHLYPSLLWDLGRIERRLRISTFQARCRDTKQKEEDRKRQSAHAELMEQRAKRIAEAESEPNTADYDLDDKHIRALKLRFQLQSRPAGTQHDPDAEEEQFQLARLVSELWKWDRRAFAMDKVGARGGGSWPWSVAKKFRKTYE